MNQQLLATWGTIGGLALMLVGGLVLWAYGGRKRSVFSNIAAIADIGVEAAGARLFHQRLARWFFTYGVILVTLGLVLLLWAASVFLSPV